MVGLARQRRLERGAPVGEALPRRAVDEVEADLVEPGLTRPGHRLGHPSGVVGALEDVEHVRHGGLHAEGDPGEAEPPEALEVGRRDGVGVGLRRHLGVCLQTELRLDRGEHAAQVVRAEQRGGAATDEDGRDGWRLLAQHLACAPHLADRRLRVRRARDTVAELVGGVGVEVAVAAPHRAVGHVDVEGEGPLVKAGQRRAGQGPVLGDRVAGRQGGRHSRSVSPGVRGGGGARARRRRGCGGSRVVPAQRLSTCGPCVGPVRPGR